MPTKYVMLLNNNLMDIDMDIDETMQAKLINLFTSRLFLLSLTECINYHILQQIKYTYLFSEDKYLTVLAVTSDKI